MKKLLSEYYQKYKLYVFPAIVVLSSLVLIIFVIYPQAVKLITDHKDEGDILNKSKFLEAKAQTLENIDPAVLNKKVDFALSSYPTEKDFVSVIAILQNITTQSGYTIVSISLGSGSTDSKIQSYDIKLDVSGSRSLLPILLTTIESSPRLMKVSSVEIVSGGSTDASTIALTVNILYSSAPKEFGEVDSDLPELSSKDEEIVAKLARSGSIPPISTQLGPRGKTNPFQ